MIAYQTKSSRLVGSSYSELAKKARLVFSIVRGKTKRRPYLRSLYFNREKIFFDYFWSHITQKGFRERIRRLKYLPCAMELIRNSRHKPLIIDDPHDKNAKFYRFLGISKEGEPFYVQIKEDLKTKNKYLMSVFPID